MERLPSLWVDKAMIRLLLSDIDGTLIQYDPKIHKTDVDAIHQLQEHGVQFGLVTGRDIGFCRHLLTHHNLQADCIVANNGGSLWIQKHKVFEHHMDGEEVIAIMKQLDAYVGMCHPFICSEEREFFLMKHAYTADAWQSIRKTLAYLGNLSEEDLLQHLHRTKASVVKISLYTCNEQTTNALLPKLQAIFKEYEVLPTSIDYIEITKKGIHKGNTVCTLMDKLHLKKHEVGVIGDGHNDVPMFSCVEHSFVMESAQEEGKRHGKRIVKSVAQAVQCVIQYNQNEE